MYFAYITQRLRLDDAAVSRFLDSVRYVAMAIAHRWPLRASPRPLWAYAALLPGYLLYLRNRQMSAHIDATAALADNKR